MEKYFFISILLVIAFFMGYSVGKPKPASPPEVVVISIHQHKWFPWKEPIHTFNGLYQTRQCMGCGEAESRSVK